MKTSIYDAFKLFLFPLSRLATAPVASLAVDNQIPRAFPQPGWQLYTITGFTTTDLFYACHSIVGCSSFSSMVVIPALHPSVCIGSEYRRTHRWESYWRPNRRHTLDILISGMGHLTPTRLAAMCKRSSHGSKSLGTEAALRRESSGQDALGRVVDMHQSYDGVRGAHGHASRRPGGNTRRL